ncbi:MAG: metallophosphoesterase [Acidobacteria bacterium]|nr:metallophosphoesterase [Acidobacteriota bacterium]
MAKQLPMVGWYDPRQLAKTGIEVAISTIFGRHSDQRLVEAMASDEDEKFYDYTYEYLDDGHAVCEPDETKPRTSIWIDYVGDVGDGWNSTYAIASHLAELGRTFTYTDPRTGTERSDETVRGEVLIFGGDEVYPTASREVYNLRLMGPYETAMRYTHGSHPHVFAIPGNHDWYDSLVAFTRLFTSHRWFAGWRTRQSRSYFALKLPHNWWLLGTDVQLGSDIDGPQVAYFARLSEEMEAETKRTGKHASVILCHAEPHWINAAVYGAEDSNYSESNLKLLEKRLGHNVAVFIAGDLHHYRRHESLDQSCQKIIAGGGGAFLHPTHEGLRGKSLDVLIEKSLDGQMNDRTFKLKACYPPKAESRKLCWRNLIFPYLKGNASWSFGLVTAALYLLTTLSVVSRINDNDRHFQLETYNLWSIASTALFSTLDSTVTSVLVVAILLGFLFFTDTHSRWYRSIMGPLHGLAHIIAAFAVALIVVTFVIIISGRAHSEQAWVSSLRWGGYRFMLDWGMLVAALLILLGGYVFGSLIMGLYLLISMNLFGRHANEAFSSISVEDWKNTLRLHIDEEGTLTIYPIGIRRVPRKWKRRTSGTGPEMLPDDPQATPPELIEAPVVMQKAITPTGVEEVSRSYKPPAA